MATAAVTRTPPYDWYADPAVLRVEQERIFARSWQYAARLDQVAEPGRLTTAFAGTLPVVLARARDGELRGFVNVCRHRGHPLCDGDARRETIQCPYHAWTYGLDGSLRSAPRSDREPGFDRSALGLVPVSVDTWGPFVFVNPDREAAPLADHLGDLPARLADGGLDVDGLRFHSRDVGDDYACNWKVCVENFLECYHCSVAHPSLTKAIDVSPDAYRLEAHGRLASQVGPSKSGGAFDTGEVGVDGVAVELLNSSDTVVGTDTTAGGGLYSFASLAAGDYRVRLAATNFQTGGPLANFTSSTTTAADPDDDVNNNDDGVVSGVLGGSGVIVSGVITLAAGAEPTNDGDTDANTNM